MGANLTGSFIASLKQITPSVQTDLTGVVYDSGVLTSTCSSIDVTGLDMDADGGVYEIIAIQANATAGSGAVSMYINGETAADIANYTRERGYFEAAGALNTAQTASTAYVWGCNITDQATAHGYLMNSNGYVYSHFVNGLTNANAAHGTYLVSNGRHSAAVANVTQLTFTASTADSLGIGSRLIIKKI